MKVCVVSSGGGHLTEVRMPMAAYRPYPHFYVLNKQVLLPEDMRDNTYNEQDQSLRGEEGSVRLPACDDRLAYC